MKVQNDGNKTLSNCNKIVYYRILKEKLFKKQNTQSNMKYYAKI